MNDFELLTTTLERRRAEARHIVVRGLALEEIIVAYEVVLADLQGLPAAETAGDPAPAVEAVSAPTIEPEPDPGPQLDNEVAELVAQIDLSIPYREMAAGVRDVWYESHGDQIRRLFEITTAGAVSQALGIPSGSITAAKKKVGAVVHEPLQRLPKRGTSPPEVQPTSAEIGTPPQENGSTPVVTSQPDSDWRTGRPLDPMIDRGEEPTPSENRTTHPENGTTPPETGTCAHRWDIETPNGPTSLGVCSLCGEEKDFKNSEPDSGWGRTPKAESA